MSYRYFILDFTESKPSIHPTVEEIPNEDVLFKVLQDKLVHKRKISVYRGECVMDLS